MDRDDALYKRARERALYLLDYRDHCYAEIVTKLLRKYDEDIAYGVADELSDKGVSDWSKIKSSLKDGLSDYLWKKTKRRPMILPIIMEV